MNQSPYLILLFLSAQLFGQFQSGQYILEWSEKCAFIEDFNEEDLFSPYSVAQKEQKGITLDWYDIPICEQFISDVVALGASVEVQSKWLNAMVVTISDSTALAEISLHDYIKNIELVKTGRAHTTINKWDNEQVTYHQESVNDSLFYGLGYRQIEMLQGNALHAFDYRGQGMRIAVFDGGFKEVDKIPYFFHLFEEDRIHSILNYNNNSTNCFDHSGHGTGVLSTMAALMSSDTIDFYSTAPMADYFLFVTEIGGSESKIEEINWANAAAKADSIGIDIITSSLGYSQFDYEPSNYSYDDLNGDISYSTRAADLAAKKGILVVTSAGNEGDDPWFHVTCPADADSILSVGAVDADEFLADFSGRGPSSDDRIKPEIMAMGRKSVIINHHGLGTDNGTSYSCPIIAGLSACLWQKFPDKSNMEIRSMIIESSHNYLFPDNDFGYGIPDFSQCIDTQFNVAELQLPDDRKEIIVLYENNSIDIFYYDTISDVVDIQILNSSGQVFLQKNNVSLSPYAYNKIELTDYKDLAKGIYLVQVSRGTDIQVAKFVKY